MQKQQIIFLVGPDMTGKTNIAQALSQKIHIPIYKASTEHNNFLSKQDRFISDIRYSCPARLDLLKQTNLSVIYDRGYPCEWVYSQFFNRQTDLAAIEHLDQEYSALNAKIICCTRKSFAGINDDLDPRINQQALEKLHKLYQDFLNITKCNSYTLFVDDQNITREIDEILKFIYDIDFIQQLKFETNLLGEK